MTTTDDLIRDLAADVKPLSPDAAQRRLAAGIVLGLVGSLALAFAWLGAPLQAVHQTGAAVLAMKLLYAMAILALSSMLLLAAGRPQVETQRRWLWLLVPPTVLLLSAAVELALPRQGQAIWLESMWWMCVATMTALSVPIFVGLLWAFRHLAPTRLRLTGLFAGLTAGSAAAALYALYCPGTSVMFLLTWYSLGILIPGLIGLLIGPRLLRW